MLIPKFKKMILINLNQIIKLINLIFKTYFSINTINKNTCKLLTQFSNVPGFCKKIYLLKYEKRDFI